MDGESWKWKILPEKKWHIPRVMYLTQTHFDSLPKYKPPDDVLTRNRQLPDYSTYPGFRFFRSPPTIDAQTAESGITPPKRSSSFSSSSLLSTPSKRSMRWLIVFIVVVGLLLAASIAVSIYFAVIGELQNQKPGVVSYNGEVKMNHPFTSALSNSSSQEYKNFSKAYCEEGIELIYKDIIVSCYVTNIRNGSILVYFTMEVKITGVTVTSLEQLFISKAPGNAFYTSYKTVFNTFTLTEKRSLTSTTAATTTPNVIEKTSTMKSSTTMLSSTMANATTAVLSTESKTTGINPEISTSDFKGTTQTVSTADSNGSTAAVSTSQSTGTTPTLSTSDSKVQLLQCQMHNQQLQLQQCQIKIQQVQLLQCRH